MKYYFLIVNDEQIGPLTFEELQQLGVAKTTPVWNEGLPDWTPAGELPELQSLFSGEQITTGDCAAGYQGAMPPRWKPEVYVTEGASVTDGKNKPRRGHAALWTTAIIITALFITMALTCPTREDHERAIASVTKEWMGDKLDSWGADGMLGSMFKMLGGMGTDYAVDQMLDVDDYFLWSVGYITFGDNRSRASLGIMGHVFTFNKDNIDQAFNEWVGITGGSKTDKKEEVAPPATDNGPESATERQNDDEQQLDEADDNDRGIVDNLVDTITGSLKREGKEWLKRLIDNL